MLFSRNTLVFTFLAVSSLQNLIAGDVKNITIVNAPIKATANENRRGGVDLSNLDVSDVVVERELINKYFGVLKEAIVSLSKVKNSSKQPSLEGNDAKKLKLKNYLENFSLKYPKVSDSKTFKENEEMQPGDAESLIKDYKKAIQELEDAALLIEKHVSKLDKWGNNTLLGDTLKSVLNEIKSNQ